MKKRLREFCILFVTTILVIGTTSVVSVFATDDQQQATLTDDLSMIDNGSIILKDRPHFQRTKKINVTKTTEWSGYHRISDSIKVKSGQSMKIYADWAKTISTSISVLRISTSVSLSSKVGYELSTHNVGVWFMRYRALYNVEKGTRVVYHGVYSLAKE